MKRTEKKLKAKGIKTHIPNDAHAYYWYKYNRYYVARNYGEASVVPFSRGSKRFYESGCYHGNHRMYQLLRRFFPKQVGKTASEVLSKFHDLGWKNSLEMYHYWDGYFRNNHDGYFVDDEGVLARKTKPQHAKTSEYLYDPDFYDDLFDDDDNDDVKPVAARPRASEKRLTRKQLDYNEAVIAEKINRIGDDKCEPELLGELYIEYGHGVVKREVYLVPYPVNTWDLTPVKVLGIYKEEKTFSHHRYQPTIVTQFNKKEQMIEAEMVVIDTGKGILIPCIK